MTAIVDIFSLLTAAAGWYYMFYSRAAQRLERIESAPLNNWRVRLRRLGGFFMLLLGVLFFAGFQADLGLAAFVVVWLSVLFLLAAIVILAIIDVRLTWKLRRQRRNPQDQDA